MADRLPSAALGFCSHSGWAAAASIGGPAQSPVVFDRRRLLLTSAPLPREPYHLAKRCEGKQAEEIVAAAVDEARSLAAEAIADLAASAAARGYEVVAAGVIVARGRPHFTLEQALSTHAAMHNAEGWLFRQALMQAGEALGLRVAGVTPDTACAETAAAAAMAVPEVEARIKGFGGALGPPWGKDQKLSSAAAWLALARARPPEA